MAHFILYMVTSFSWCLSTVIGLDFILLYSLVLSWNVIRLKQRYLSFTAGWLAMQFPAKTVEVSNLRGTLDP